MTITNLDYWLKNDPNPNKTLDMIKQKIERKKRLSKENPIQLMREEMPKDEWNAYWREKREAEIHYLHTRGFTKKENGQFDMKHIAMIPQVVYNQNVEYWSDIISTRQFHKHPEFLVSSPTPKKICKVF
jgi:hypothetical protein